MDFSLFTCALYCFSDPGFSSLYFCVIALAVYDLLTWPVLLGYRCWKARNYYKQLVDFDTDQRGK